MRATGLNRWMVAALLGAASVAGAQQAASPVTSERNMAAARLSPDEESAEAAEDADAARGRLAQIPGGLIRTPDGATIWDWRPYAFLDTAIAPSSVHPRLWRQARRNAQHGLYEVVPGAIWQVRGYDISVMTIIRGESGWIIVDPLTTAEAAAAALGLVNAALGQRPVSAVLYSHSHADHYGGVLGVLTAADAAARYVPIIAPDGFAREAVSENVLAGPAMQRRAEYMFGTRLAPGITGQVDTGLGPRLVGGTTGYLAPTITISADGETRVIDGVTFDFLNAAGTEAPAEFLFYLPQWHALHTTEVATKTLHNLLTLRGAQIRDALHWSDVIDTAIGRWGGDVAVQLGSHGWPTFGGDRARLFLNAQRDAYRYIHDRALGAANGGATLQELPPLVDGAGIAQHPSVRGYYGTLNHDAKAVYQRYFGWWDGVPAHFDPLPPAAASTRYVALAGGPDAMLAAGRAAFAAGEYRWAAELLNHLVFAAPDNGAARAALADAYEQLGFQTESGAWRNYYLAATATLRGTELAASAAIARRQSPSFIAALPAIAVLQSLATAYVPDPARTTARHFGIRFSDTGEQLSVEARALVEIPRAGPPREPATATLIIPRALFLGLISGRVTWPQAQASGAMQVEGDGAALLSWLAAHQRPTPGFAVVTP